MGPLPKKFKALQNWVISLFLSHLESDKKAAVNGLHALLYGKWAGPDLGESVVELAKPRDLSKFLLSSGEYLQSILVA